MDLRNPKGSVGASLMALFLATASAGASEPSICIQDVEVRLFYHHSGSFSEDVTAKDAPGWVLWNTFIGEGDAAEPSGAVLVTVVLQGRSGSFESGRVVELEVVEADGTPFLRSAAEVGVFSEAGQYWCGFWLADVACRDLRLKARIAGIDSEVVEPLTFHCGE